MLADNPIPKVNTSITFTNNSVPKFNTQYCKISFPNPTKAAYRLGYRKGDFVVYWCSK